MHHGNQHRIEIQPWYRDDFKVSYFIFLFCLKLWSLKTSCELNFSNEAYNAVIETALIETRLQEVFMLKTIMSSLAKMKQAKPYISIGLSPSIFWEENCAVFLPKLWYKLAVSAWPKSLGSSKRLNQALTPWKQTPYHQCEQKEEDQTCAKGT